MLNILVVDSSLIVRKKLKIMLNELGHNVLAQATSWKDAIELSSNLNPDIIIIDTILSDVDTECPIEKLKNIYPSARIIVLTSCGTKERVKNAFLAGAEGYILKPINKDILAAKISKFHNAS